MSIARSLNCAAVGATLLLAAVGCETYRGVVGPERGRHRITIVELALSDSDFTTSALGNPKPMELRAMKDGAVMDVSRLDGFRGPKALNLSFEIDYEPKSRYEFKIDEVVIITDGKSWRLANHEPGNWLFHGRKTFGSGSSIEFRDEKIP